MVVFVLKKTHDFVFNATQGPILESKGMSVINQKKGKKRQKKKKVKKVQKGAKYLNIQAKMYKF